MMAETLDERLARFYRETGIWAPGMDRSAAEGEADADQIALAAWTAWNKQDARAAELEEALTPSAATKAAYMGEVRGDCCGEFVPWTTIKDVMSMIRARAEELWRRGQPQENPCKSFPVERQSPTYRLEINGETYPNLPEEIAKLAIDGLALRRLGNENPGNWVCRESSTGRGMRVHQTSSDVWGEVSGTPAEAIRKFYDIKAIA